MRKFQTYEIEVWDYKDKEEYLKHRIRKLNSGFEVISEYDNKQLLEAEGENSFTAHYRRIHN